MIPAKDHINTMEHREVYEVIIHLFSMTPRLLITAHAPGKKELGFAHGFISITRTLSGTSSVNKYLVNECLSNLIICIC